MTPWLDLVGGRMAHSGAQLLWKQIVAPQQELSNVRCHSKAKSIFVIAKNLGTMGEFHDTRDTREHGEATSKKLRAFYNDHGKRHELRCALAGMLDMHMLVKFTQL
eukprot:159379-Pleurochrysis_carterae.AAC.4